MLQTLGTIRRFETPNFSVIVDAVEDYDVDLSWDDTGAVRAKLESGEYVCFTARARVYYKGRELADDYLGGMHLREHRGIPRPSGVRRAATRRARESGARECPRRQLFR